MFSRKIFRNQVKFDCELLSKCGWRLTTDREQVTRNAGIYAIFDCHKKECLYVGKSQNIWQRLRTNGNWDKAIQEFNEPVVCFYEVDITEPMEILYLESLAIGLLRPKWNFFGNNSKTRRNTVTSNYISEAELRTILNTEKSSRNRVIIILGYFAGLSSTEISHLKWRDIDEHKMQIIISAQGKGSRRCIPLNKVLVATLSDFRQPENTLEEYIFRSIRGKKLDRSMIHKIVKTAATNANVGANVSVTTLRNSYGLNLLESGLDVSVIQKRLGVKRFKALIHKSNIEYL